MVERAYSVHCRGVRLRAQRLKRSSSPGTEKLDLTSVHCSPRTKTASRALAVNASSPPVRPSRSMLLPRG